MRVLVVEDDPLTASMLRRGLTEDGYSVDVATDGIDALWRASEVDYDSVVLDLMLPGIDGLEVCRRLREAGRWAPVLMLTARSGIEDRVAGLDSGADDYLAKPFSFAELSARLRALVRRGSSARPAVLAAGDLRLDPSTRQAWRGDVPLDLSGKEFALLELFLRRVEEVLSRPVILEHVWDFAYDGRQQRRRPARCVAAAKDRPAVRRRAAGDDPRCRLPPARRAAHGGDVTIRSRLTLIFSAVTLAILIGGSVLFITRLKGGLEQSLTASAASHAYTLASVIGPHPSTDPRAWARQRGLFVSRGGSYDQLLTTQGEILGSSRALAPSPLLTAEQVRAAAKRSLVFDATVRLTVPTDSGPEPVRIFAQRVGRSPVIVAVADSRDVLDRAVASARRELEVLDLVVFLLGVTGSWLLTRAALLPVERMRLQAADLDARNAGAGLQVPGSHDEIARLGHTFNRLLSRVHGLVAREQALVADAGHELRTPLTVLKGELELARRPGRSAEELSQTVDVAAEETNRLVRLTEDLLFLSAEDDAGRPADTFDLSDTVAAAVRVASASERARDVAIVVTGDEHVIAGGKPEWIRRAVDNLLANAIRYAPAGSAVTVTIRQDPTSTEVAVDDDGPGFPAQFLPIAFNRFTRADESRARAAAADESGRAVASVWRSSSRS